MKFLLSALVLVAIVATCFAAFNVETVRIIQEINNNRNTKWKAAPNKFSTWSTEKLRSLAGTIVKPSRYNIDVKPQQPNGDIPDSFDWRSVKPKCIHPIRDQGHCGSCWAFAGSEVLSDRFCIASNGTVDVVLSPQDMVSCDSGDYGCQGGYLTVEWQYMVSKGIVSDKCFPYVSGDGSVPSCPSTCPGISGKSLSNDKYKATTYRHVGGLFSREKDIKTEIMNKGPVEAAFSVYQDFISYKSGVYHHASGGFLGGHAIKIVGWGVDATTGNTPYWIIANSWGNDWGLNGFFWMLRGKNECGIEAQVYTGDPDLSHIPSQ